MRASADANGAAVVTSPVRGCGLWPRPRLGHFRFKRAMTSRVCALCRAHVACAVVLNSLSGPRGPRTRSSSRSIRLLLLAPSATPVTSAPTPTTPDVRKRRRGVPPDESSLSGIGVTSMSRAVAQRSRPSRARITTLPAPRCSKCEWDGKCWTECQRLQNIRSKSTSPS
jgi:hypothetical protein